jgi:hypothetical protein
MYDYLSVVLAHDRHRLEQRMDCEGLDSGVLAVVEWVVMPNVAD